MIFGVTAEALMEMRLRANDAQGFDTVLLKGDCDLYNAPRMKTAIINRIGTGMRKLRLDFEGVAYLDSTGVGAIIQILQAMKTVTGEVVFRGITGAPRKVLEMSNVISLMKLEQADAAR